MVLMPVSQFDRAVARKWTGCEQQLLELHCAINKIFGALAGQSHRNIRQRIGACHLFMQRMSEAQGHGYFGVSGRSLNAVSCLP